MTTPDLPTIEAAARGVYIQEPWEADDDLIYPVSEENECPIAEAQCETYADSKALARYIAAVPPSTILSLIARIRELEAEVARLQRVAEAAEAVDDHLYGAAWLDEKSSVLLDGLHLALTGSLPAYEDGWGPTGPDDPEATIREALEMVRCEPHQSTPLYLNMGDFRAILNHEGARGFWRGVAAEQAVSVARDCPNIEDGKVCVACSTYVEKLRRWASEGDSKERSGTDG